MYERTCIKDIEYNRYHIYVYILSPLKVPDTILQVWSLDFNTTFIFVEQILPFLRTGITI